MASEQVRQGVKFDMGDMFRLHRVRYQRDHAMSAEQRKVLHDMSVCRTAFLGGHVLECSEGCGHEQQAYNSCRNRHCPKCQGIAMRKWVDARLQELLPVSYFHNIFTMPHCFNVLLPYNEALMYNILFKSASSAIKEQAQKELGGQVGVIAVLHTWGQQLIRHVHLHCLITAGALSSSRTRWIPSTQTYLMNVHQLSDKFKQAFCQALRKAYKQGHIKFKYKDAIPLSAPDAFEVFLATNSIKPWVIYSQKPFAGPAKVVQYLGRYTHRVAISNSRILAVTDTDITFDYKDYKDLDDKKIAKHKQRTLPIDKFMTRFLQHVLPAGFRKIRYYGFLGGCWRKDNIALCRRLINEQGLAVPIEMPDLPIMESPDEQPCPNCGHVLRVKSVVLPTRIRAPDPFTQVGDVRHVA